MLSNDSIGGTLIDPFVCKVLWITCPSARTHNPVAHVTQRQIPAMTINRMSTLRSESRIILNKVYFGWFQSKNRINVSEN